MRLSQGMMTVNRISPGGVAEAAGVKEGFVLMRLGGHDLLKVNRRTCLSFAMPFYAKNDRFTQTGSGQTSQGKHSKKRDAFYINVKGATLPQSRAGGDRAVLAR
jgi:hypothetical protein